MPPAGYEFQSLPEGAIRLEVQSAGFRRTTITGIVASQQNVQLQIGEVTETVAITAAAPSIQTANADIASRGTGATGRALGSGAALGRMGRLGGVGSGSGGGFGAGAGGGIGGGSFRPAPVAVAQELGDLFEYKLKDPVTIPKNRSALLPIVQSPITAEKVSIWNEQAGLPRPQRALWLTNSSGLTLDGGSFSVMDEETFAGEGIFEPIRPGEKRLVSYALDLALNVSSHNRAQVQRIARVRISRGIMTHKNEVRESKTYTFRNEDSSPRAVIVEHPARQGYELRGEARPVETTAGWMRFRLQVEPKQTVALVVEEARPLEAHYELTNVSSEQVDLFVQNGSINKAVEDALRKVLAQKGVISELDGKRSAHDEEMQKIFDDQQRLRENMKALKGSAEEKALLQRYTQQLNGQENRLEALRKEGEQLATQRASAQEVLDKMVQELSFEEKL